LQDKSKSDCLRQAIEQVLPSMPLTMRPLFEYLSCNLENENLDLIKFPLSLYELVQIRTSAPTTINMIELLLD
jgi:hypothetical protein